MKNLLLLSLLGISTSVVANSNQANPALHKLADILDHEENGLGALARLYKQIDSIADDHQGEDNDEMLFDDTRVVGLQSTNQLKGSPVVPDFDPAFNYTQPKIVPDQKEEEIEVVRPENPVFRKPGFKRADRSQQVKNPVWGVMTEPIKGNIEGGWTEYIPSSHVKFLEQTGAKVVAISYKMKKDDLYDLLDQVSGIYLHGDSNETPKSKKFQQAFGNVLSYAFEHNHDKYDYFPVFMLGNTLQTFLANRLKSDVLPLSVIPSTLYHKNVQLRVTVEPKKSFILDELTKDNLDEVMHQGTFFNRQRLGLTVKALEREADLNKRYQVVATLNSAPVARKSTSKSLQVVDQGEYIAMMESFDMPLYFILYDVSYTQFVFSERYFVSGGGQLVDHSIAARTHAQYIAQQIHDEAAHCKHRFASYYELESRLISKTGELADIDHTAVDGGSGATAMPEGMESQEVYLFK